ncbi:MAG TPA: glycosyltransferase family 92 protein, partial [Terriglobales bacterium]|nr:glycosyltransferase family 92 protein [Terriglobales bacterium]
KVPDAVPSNPLRHLTWELAIAAIFQDEARWLKEWLEYHLLIGVEHFYLYNNLSRDNYEEVLQSYIERGAVELIEWPYVGGKTFDAAQCDAYRDALSRAQNTVKWLAIIDVDEFLVPVKDDDLTSVLAAFETDSAIGGVCIAWVYFGTSYIPRIPQDKLMIETLVLNGDGIETTGAFPWDQGTFKSIVRTDRTKSFESPHVAVYNAGHSHVPLFHDLIQINHYWTKDDMFFNEVKVPRNTRRGVPVETSVSWAAAMNKETQMSAPILRFVPSLKKQMSR